MAIEAMMNIGGKRIGADEWVTVVNPAQTTAIVGRYPAGTPEHAYQAVRAAADALADWSATPAAERAALLAAAGTLLAARAGEWHELLTSENGKVLAEARLDFAMAGRAFSTYGTKADLVDGELIEGGGRRLRIQKRPIGVCVGIIPWNYPIALSAMKIAPGLLAGNTLVMKAPEFSPVAMLESLAEVAALFPPGVLNIVSGSGPAVGQALVRHPLVRKVAFTGGTTTGRQVMADAAGHIARVSLELGGNDPAILLDDVELSDENLDRIVSAAFMHTGQICVAIKRIYVHESRYQETVEALRAAVDRIVVGDGLRSEVTMGPINNARQHESVRGLLAEAKANLDCVELGSYAEGTDPEAGYFMLPHLVLDPPDAATIVSCEQMGPILPIMSFRSDEEAIARANNSEYGLTSSVWSADLEHAFAVGERIEAGKTGINAHGLFAVDPQGPSDAVKQSGLGHEMGPRAIESWQQRNSVTNAWQGPPRG
jgi:acyl-CoA reductase-like NAD-dependent aldehyde dehydrogenase